EVGRSSRSASLHTLTHGRACEMLLFPSKRSKLLLTKSREISDRIETAGQSEEAHVGLTEEQYLRLKDPMPALNLFNSRKSPLRTSTRKARLFCCAVCRRVWNWLGPDSNRAAVEAGERAADGLIRVKDLRPFFEATQEVPVTPRSSTHANPAAF